MKFIDAAQIHVIAGKGGDGCCSFLRLKFMPFGGPDGGNGGDGGSVFLLADPSKNTLVDLMERTYRAADGENGRKRNCYGKSGDDLVLRVPVGTVIYDYDTGELIDDLAYAGQKSCVAHGGRHGVGNSHFKSSTNRSPRRIILGLPGEQRKLRLELKILADVGLLGLPNAGKSTLLKAISAAHPKISDYPFTTLVPQLGVVRVASDASFVVADLPGLILGAAEGLGLGTQFLKHVARNKLLWHVIDLLPLDNTSLVENYNIINQELVKYNPTLLEKEQWLIFNKSDLLSSEQIKTLVQDFLEQIAWNGKYFVISGVNKQGIKTLIDATMAYLT